MTATRKTRHLFALALAPIVAAAAATAEEACTLMSWQAAPDLRSHVLDTGCDNVEEQGLVCFWEFAYRNPAAQTFYQAMGDNVSGCLGAAAETPPEPGVNHPDSYALRQFAAEGRLISVSLKDKAQMDKSIVFLRIGSDGGG